MTDEQKYLLDKLLSRIDYYIGSINAKSAFIITFNTFILGTILLKYNDTINAFTHEKFSYIIPIIILVILFGSGMSLCNVFKAVIPYMESGNKPSSYHSLLFFGSISQMSLDDFNDRVLELDKDKLLNDLVRQTHILSIGINNKFNYISKSVFWAVYFILIPIGLVILLKVIDWFII